MRDLWNGRTSDVMLAAALPARDALACFDITEDCGEALQAEYSRAGLFGVGFEHQGS